MKFRLGDIVIIHTVRGWCGNPPHAIPCEGEVILIGPFPAGHIYDDEHRCPADSDYLLITEFGTPFSAQEWQLRKRPEQGIPKSIIEIFSKPQDVRQWAK